MIAPLLVGWFRLRLINIRREWGFSDNKEVRNIPLYNELLLQIPSISVSEEIRNLDESNGSKQSLWKVQYSFFPGNGETSILIIAGHRISYGNIAPPPFFYINYLDKGDEIYVWYKRRKYEYEVTEVIEVENTEVSIEKVVEGKHKLVLYTCTPVVNPKKRLVINADLVSID